MRIISKVYNSKIYIFAVVILALYSLFNDTISAWLDWSIYGLFIFDLIIGTTIWVRTEPDKTVKKYFKHFIWDILACVPFYEFDIFKMFRLFRVVRIVKLRKVTESEIKFNWTNVFSIQTVRELSVWLLIYFVANVYLFDEIEHRTVIDGIYWLVETMTSVGYGDIVPTHTTTKILGIMLMLIGIATIGYLNGVITTTVVKNLNHRKS